MGKIIFSRKIFDIHCKNEEYYYNIELISLEHQLYKYSFYKKQNKICFIIYSQDYIELLFSYEIFGILMKNMHNPTGYAYINYEKNIKEYWIKGVKIHSLEFFLQKINNM